MPPIKSGIVTRFIAILAFISIYYMLIDKYDAAGILLGWIPSIIVASVIIYTLRDWMVAIAAILIGIIFIIYLLEQTNKYAKTLEFIATFFQ